MPQASPREARRTAKIFGGDAGVQTIALRDALMNYHRLMEGRGKEPSSRIRPPPKTDRTAAAAAQRHAGRGPANADPHPPNHHPPEVLNSPMSICKNGLVGGACRLGSFGLSAAILSGCGGSEGVTTGASSPSSITIKHGKEKAGGGAAATTQGRRRRHGGAARCRGRLRDAEGPVIFRGHGSEAGVPDGAGRDAKSRFVPRQTIPDQKLVDSKRRRGERRYLSAEGPAGSPCLPYPATWSSSTRRAAASVPHVLLMRVGQTVKILNRRLSAAAQHAHFRRSGRPVQQHDSHKSKGSTTSIPSPNRSRAR